MQDENPKFLRKLGPRIDTIFETSPVDYNRQQSLLQWSDISVRHPGLTLTDKRDPTQDKRLQSSML